MRNLITIKRGERGAVCPWTSQSDVERRLIDKLVHVSLKITDNELSFECFSVNFLENIRILNQRFWGIPYTVTYHNW